ncbi:MAG: hypothetical protein RIQ62_594, partial [Bacteroidota bacterium]
PPPVPPQVKFTPPVIKKAEEVREDEKPAEQKELETKMASTTNAEGNTTNIEAPPVLEKPNTVENAAPAKEEIFEFVEQNAEFPGGDDALYKYLGEHIHYSNQAREQGITGKVVLTFVVHGGDGSISDVKVIRSLGYGLDEEAIRQVKSMPRWKPAKQNGKDVSSTFTLPIDFRLDEE